jgi:hypothetical protein
MGNYQMLKSIGRLLGLSVLAATLGVSAPALAVTTVQFSGAITSSPDPLSDFPDLDGELFNGTFAFDETASDVSPGGSTGNYNSVGAIYGATLSGGGFDLDITGGTVHNDLIDGGIDMYTLMASQTVDIDGLGSFFIQLTILLSDFTATALSSDALVAPTLAAFPNYPWVQIAVTDLTRNVGGLYHGTLTSLTVVPVPAALPLLGAGLAALGFMGWRKKRAAVAA